MRQIPVGLYNVNNQPMNSADYIYAVRFVLDRDTKISRFFGGFNLEGTDWLGGRPGYSHGSGGIVRAQLCEVKADGTPNMRSMLGVEVVSVQQRYEESKLAYGAPGKTQLLHWKMGGPTLAAGRMYAMTYRNVDPNPSVNWFSENSPTVKDSVAGPNGVNTLDPNAPGAIAGLDPREAVAWSQDGGKTWLWGRHVGEGNTPGSYGGSAVTDDGTRLPWYGWQRPNSAPESNQPYYAYTASGAYTLELGPSPKSVVLTEAGGYAPVGSSVGVVTVKNLRTGQIGVAAPLGGGLARGPLDRPVTIGVGDSHTISNSGRVLKAEGDSFIVSTFKIGSGRWPFHTWGYDLDVAQLFALPHPWFAA
jgi:hypothetical protein